VTVGLIAGIAALTSMALPLYSALAVKQSVAAAADAAALAAADVAVGRAPGYPCEVAAYVAAANGASVTACDLDGLVATIMVQRTLLGVPVVATATAGPPP
jgi:secretion/DNA translocation related TadE-like protein